MKIKLSSKTGEYQFDVMFGTDAEFFLEKDGKVIPASQVIPGTKSNPHKLDHGVCHPDGLSLEVGCPPSDTPSGMLANLMLVLQEVKEKYLDPAGVVISSRSQVAVEEAINPKKDDLEFGCGSEDNAYTVSKKVKHSTSDHLRFSGFHIHLGFTEHEDTWEVKRDMASLVRSLDLRVRQAGLGTTHERAQQYGGYGSFRVKPYGIEYRAMDCSVALDPNKLKRMMNILEDIESVFSQATRVRTSIHDRVSPLAEEYVY